MKIAIIGDHHATKSVYNFGDKKISVDGMPINDSQLPTMLKFAWDRFDLIFWSCGHPLMGCQAINIIRELSSMPFKKRTLNYQAANIPKGFYDSEWWKSLSESDYVFLWENYRGMLNHYLSNYGSKIILLPLASLWFDAQLGLELKAMEAIQTITDKIVDLSPIAAMSPEYFQNTSQLLTEAGFNKIKPNLKAFVNLSTSS